MHEKKSIINPDISNNFNSKFRIHILLEFPESNTFRVLKNKLYRFSEGAPSTVKISVSSAMYSALDVDAKSSLIVRKVSSA